MLKLNQIKLNTGSGTFYAIWRVNGSSLLNSSWGLHGAKSSLNSKVNKGLTAVLLIQTASVSRCLPRSSGVRSFVLPKNVLKCFSPTINHVTVASRHSQDSKQRLLPTLLDHEFATFRPNDGLLASQTSSINKQNEQHHC